MNNETKQKYTFTVPEDKTAIFRAKLDRASDISDDIREGTWYNSACRGCDLEGEDYCCNCPVEREYQDKLKSNEEFLGNVILDEAISIGRLRAKIAKEQRALNCHLRKFDSLTVFERDGTSRKEKTTFFSVVEFIDELLLVLLDFFFFP